MEIKNLQEKFRDELILVFRAYGEKPRTNVGWSGLLHDPKMDGSYNMEEGIRTMRTLMRDLADVGMASTTEILDPLTPTCLADLTALGCIGARTTESQRHRQLVS